MGEKKSYDIRQSVPRSTHLESLTCKSQRCFDLVCFLLDSLFVQADSSDPSVRRCPKSSIVRAPKHPGRASIFIEYDLFTPWPKRFQLKCLFFWLVWVSSQCIVAWRNSFETVLGKPLEDPRTREHPGVFGFLESIWNCC